MKDEIKEILDKLNKLKYDDIHLIICEVISRREIKILLDYITNLKEKQTKKVFDTLATLISKNETCTYRYLIYDLLGFDKSSYTKLIGGMAITNALVDLEDYKSRFENAIEYLEYQISQLDFEKDTKAKMLGAMVLVLLKGSDNNE